MTERSDANYTNSLLNNEDLNVTSSKRKRPSLFDDPLRLKLISTVLAILCVLLGSGLITSILLKSNDNTICSNDFGGSLKNATSNTSISLKKPKLIKHPSGSPNEPNLDQINLPIESGPIQGNLRWNHSRLPVNFKPSLYTLDLRIDVIKKEFFGNCTIQFECTKNAPFLVLHVAENIVFSESQPFPVITEIDSDLNVVEKLDVVKLEINQFYTYVIIILAEGTIFKQDRKYLVSFENYFSNITNNLKGLYYSTYNTEAGEVRPLVVSQLQPLDARAVFPGFDEPNLKAKFAISIQHHNSKLNTLLNMIKNASKIIL